MIEPEIAFADLYDCMQVLIFFSFKKGKKKKRVSSYCFMSDLYDCMQVCILLYVYIYTHIHIYISYNM